MTAAELAFTAATPCVLTTCWLLAIRRRFTVERRHTPTYGEAWR